MICTRLKKDKKKNKKKKTITDVIAFNEQTNIEETGINIELFKKTF